MATPSANLVDLWGGGVACSYTYIYMYIRCHAAFISSRVCRVAGPPWPGASRPRAPGRPKGLAARRSSLPSIGGMLGGLNKSA